jgi:hypothetical protein
MCCGTIVQAGLQSFCETIEEDRTVEQKSNSGVRMLSVHMLVLRHTLNLDSGVHDVIPIQRPDGSESRRVIRGRLR